MAYIYDLADTWNASGTTFTAIKMNVTDSASSINSRFLDFQIGGTSRFRVMKGSQATGFAIQSDTAAEILANNSVGLQLRWSTSTTLTVDGIGVAIGTNGNAWLATDATNTLAQRNGVNAQTSRLYGTFTDASNYRRLASTMSAGGVAEIKPEGSGTGASGNVLHISGLPTSNPGPGILWNNAGTPAIGT